MGDLAWYEELREAYRPAEIRVLLIAESPPDPGAGRRRFFYSPVLTHDNLYRGVAEALYGREPGFTLADKSATLERIKSDGYWLIDAVETPINKSSSSLRRKAIADGIPGLLERCQGLNPKRGVIICHGKVFEAAAESLRAGGVTLLHDRPLPFPVGNWRREFVDGFRRAIG
jgi:hypothetical protein